MKQICQLATLFTLLIAPAFAFSQETGQEGTIHGNFELNSQYYQEDSIIKAPKVPEKMRMNAYTNLVYTKGDFSAGIRYEAYLNPMLGYDSKYAGNGIAYRYASFKRGDLEVTVGNFYDQFGNGLVFRSYEEKTLGIDNSMDGIQVKYAPVKGVFLKGIYGNQRYYWAKSNGIMRGADAEFFLNDMFPSMEMWKTKLVIGGSIVSKYQKDDPTSKYIFPENVSATAVRMEVIRGRVHLSGEYAYIIYKPGEALFLNASYSRKGLGIVLAAKRIDNMNFRSDRMISGNPLTINYLPTITKQHTYSLAAVYPYASQANGEIGYYASMEYHIKKGSKLGGKYGTSTAVNFSHINAIDRQPINSETVVGKSGTLGYTSDFFKFGKEEYFQDFNVEVSHKFNMRWKGIFTFLNLAYNQSVIEGHQGAPMVYANVAVADITYILNEKNAVRVELQGLTTKQDKGDWAMILAEYTIAPKWFVSAMDMYNYGNELKEEQLHYYLFSAGYTKGSNRISLAYGRQRQGILCVGGVCRAVPASNGFQLSITSTF
ncbi:MAG: DUF6029 family protein [Bacteroidetes bacterium]|nr:DUF6029 family protein [Bacteroidota bacterium]